MRHTDVIILIAVLLSRCGPLPPPVPRPPQLCHAPGGGYVACDPGYHGSGGPWTQCGRRRAGSHVWSVRTAGLPESWSRL